MASNWTNVCRNVPCKPKVTLPRWEEERDEDCCNPDKLFSCPYDPSHEIRACRFPYHLIKCRKNNPLLASKLWTCPFNARHLMPKHEMSEHMATCIYRCSVNNDSGETDKAQCKLQVPVNTWTVPVCDEDWDQEEEERAAPRKPFIWGVSTPQHCQDWSEPSVSNTLTSSIRAPRDLPWKTGL